MKSTAPHLADQLHSLLFGEPGRAFRIRSDGRTSTVVARLQQVTALSRAICTVLNESDLPRLSRTERRALQGLRGILPGVYGRRRGGHEFSLLLPAVPIAVEGAPRASRPI